MLNLKITQMMPYSMKFAKKAKNKIKFQKMKDTFMDSIHWLKSHRPPLIYTYLYICMCICIMQRISLYESSSALLLSEKHNLFKYLFNYHIAFLLYHTGMVKYCNRA